jgi:hypothetical protein
MGVGLCRRCRRYSGHSLKLTKKLLVTAGEKINADVLLKFSEVASDPPFL